MNMRQIAFVALLLSLNFSNLFAASSDFIAAKVNQKAITQAELNDRYRFVLISARLKINSDSDKKTLLEQILEKMIDEEVITQSAKTFNISTSEKEIEEAAEDVALNQGKDSKEMRQFFRKNNLSFSSHLKQIEAEVLWSKIIREIIRPRVKVTEIEIREFLEQHKVETEVKRLHIAELTIENSTKNSEVFAKKLSSELRQGANFKSLAQQFSTSFGENDGEIGWVSKNDVDAKIYEKIAHLKKGQYSDPVLLNDGFHIFKILDHKTETHISDNDMRAARDALMNRKIQNAARSYLMDLRKKAFVEIKL
jgi:parvulin-like peptidyl-prolyl isomerase